MARGYGLLPGAERPTLARLTVFAGSFELEAAQTVVAGPEINETQVLDLLTALADGSLLKVGEHDGQAHYRLLETLRMYVGARLAELDDSARRATATWTSPSRWPSVRRPGWAARIPRRATHGWPPTWPTCGP
jgi:predicted ATPase